ncbi:MAG: cyanophycinase [Flavobacterium sp.]|nr:MAG: cyanophycinase [Flavobacterium sp.]
MQLKGKLVIIGGAEDKGKEKDQGEFTENGILRRLIEESAHKKQSRIEVITTASSVPEEMGNDYIKAFKKLDATNVGVLNIDNREAADSARVIKRLEAADIAFFTGGDQIRLTSILGGSDFYRLLRDKLQQDKNFIFAGTSAGAAAASESMIVGGSSEHAITKGAVQTSTGFGFVYDVIFDTHFVKRGRIGRLFEIVLTNPKILGIGIEENTGLLIIGDKMEAIGSGMTILIDGRDIRQTNLLEIREGAPLSIDSLCLKVMSKTDVFDLKTRTLEIITPDECKI